MDKELLKNKKWLKLGRWKEPVIMESCVSTAIVGQGGIRSILNFFPSKYIIVGHAQYVDEQEFAEGVEGIKRLFLKDPKKLRAMFKGVIRSNSRKISGFSKTELNIKTLEKLFVALSHQGRQWFEIMLADTALQELYATSLPHSFSIAGVNYSPETFLAKVALPKRLFPIIEERGSALNIASKLKKGKDIQKEITRHAKKFGWMNSLCWWDPPFDNDHYMREVEKLSKKDTEGEARFFAKSREIQRKEMLKLLKEVKRNFPEAYMYIDIIRDLTDLKEENWDAVSILGAKLRPKLEEIAQKHGLTFIELIALGKDEWRLLLKGKFFISKQELSQRISKPFLFATKNDLLIKGGTIVDEVFSIIEAKISYISELPRGMTVWPGKVIGVTRVMYSVDDVPSMQEGEILVCPMTDPDYMPAIYKASMIITDQGGVLCHAAIVARELQKPCIVSTRIATKVIQTGDLIEADAEKGFVKIIK